MQTDWVFDLLGVLTYVGPAIIIIIGWWFIYHHATKFDGIAFDMLTVFGATIWFMVTFQYLCKLATWLGLFEHTKF